MPECVGLLSASSLSLLEILGDHRVARREENDLIQSG